MTDHPCKGMTKAQIACFERIAISQPPYAGDRTIKALLARGLIVGVNRSERDGLGVFKWTEYHVPLLLHAQWCEWCSEQSEDEDGNPLVSTHGANR